MRSGVMAVKCWIKPKTGGMLIILVHILTLIPSGSTAKPWYRTTQFFSMIALPESDLTEYHITVNGLWNGYFGEIPSPFAYARYLEFLRSGQVYSSDKHFVDFWHDRGQWVPATILTSQGHSSMQGLGMDTLACRSADGALSHFDLDAGSFFMCASRPRWKSWMIRHGKKAVDAGADLIVLDEIQGSGFYPMFQWGAPYLGIDEPGFCSACMDGFRKYLKKTYHDEELFSRFGIADPDEEDLNSRIAATMDLTFRERTAVDPLNGAYFAFLEEKNFRTKRRIIKALRSYARKQGQNLAISANSYALGADRLGGYWAKGLIFSDLVDFYTFENSYSAVQTANTAAFPRNKWIAWLKLARAATGAPAVVLPAAASWREIFENALEKGKSHSHYLTIRFAEAYACRCAFANWHIPWSGDSTLWSGVAGAADFIQRHIGLYDADIESYADVGIVFLWSEHMSRRLWSFLGWGQVLAESNIPFDVIFGGGGRYLKNRLKPGVLDRYALVIVPNAREIEGAQLEGIKSYVRAGGKALVFDPLDFGLSGAGEIRFGRGSFIVVPTWEFGGEEWDHALYYFQEYRNKERNDLAALIERWVPGCAVLDDHGRNVVALPYYQPQAKRIVIHLINYDHELKSDRVTAKRDLNIRIKAPEYGIPRKAYVISPDFAGRAVLNPVFSGDAIRVTVPELKVYSLVVVGKR